MTVRGEAREGLECGGDKRVWKGEIEKQVRVRGEHDIESCWTTHWLADILKTQPFYSHLATVEELVVSQQLVVHLEQSLRFLHDLAEIGLPTLCKAEIHKPSRAQNSFYNAASAQRAQA